MVVVGGVGCGGDSGDGSQCLFGMVVLGVDCGGGSGGDGCIVYLVWWWWVMLVVVEVVVVAPAVSFWCLGGWRWLVWWRLHCLFRVVVVVGGVGCGGSWWRRLLCLFGVVVGDGVGCS